MSPTFSSFSPFGSTEMFGEGAKHRMSEEAKEQDLSLRGQEVDHKVTGVRYPTK